MKYGFLALSAAILIAGCGAAFDENGKSDAISITAKPSTNNIIFSTVADRPLSVSLRVDDLQFPHSDGILAAIDEINKDLPEGQRIAVNAAMSSSRDLVDDLKAKQKAFDDLRAAGGDFRFARRALLEVMEQVQPFFDLGLSIRTGDSVVPQLSFTKVNKVIGNNRIDIWARDNGLYGHTPSGEAAFVTTGRQGNDPTKDMLTEFYQAQLVSASSTDITENYGGNILPLPNGLLLVGANASDDLKKALAENKNYIGKIIFLEDQVLEVRHLDEQISIVPTADKCGFGIVKADPVRGKEIATAIVNGSEAFVGPAALKDTGFLRWNYDVGGATFLDDATVKTVADAINANVERIREASVKINPECKAIKVASLAVPLDRCMTNDAGSPVSCVAQASNPVNAMILGSNAITSDPFYPSLRKNVEDAFAVVGAKVKFVNTAAMKAFQGGVHCGTNVKRALKGR
jgi:Protein-arginine deiminase (PAD)